MAVLVDPDFLKWISHGDEKYVGFGGLYLVSYKLDVCLLRQISVAGSDDRVARI
ncbi:protein of unknown function [Hyphomicrobium sp. MC1]|nr:protein of unknown function [Hyphomicrobium sp. MC1]